MSTQNVRLAKGTRLLHIEAPGVVINIRPYLNAGTGHPVTNFEILANGAQKPGEPQWWLDGEAAFVSLSGRAVQTDTPTPGLTPEDQEPWILFERIMSGLESALHVASHAMPAALVARLTADLKAAEALYRKAERNKGANALPLSETA